MLSHRVDGAGGEGGEGDGGRGEVAEYLLSWGSGGGESSSLLATPPL